MTGKVGVSRGLKALGDPALDFDPVILGIIMAHALAVAIRRPQRYFGLARLFHVSGIDVAEVRIGVGARGAEAGDAGRNYGRHDSRRQFRSPYCCWMPR